MTISRLWVIVIVICCVLCVFWKGGPLARAGRRSGARVDASSVVAALDSGLRLGWSSCDGVPVISLRLEEVGLWPGLGIPVSLLHRLSFGQGMRAESEFCVTGSSSFLLPANNGMFEWLSPWGERHKVSRHKGEEAPLDCRWWVRVISDRDIEVVNNEGVVVKYRNGAIVSILFRNGDYVDVCASGRYIKSYAVFNAGLCVDSIVFEYDAAWRVVGIQKGKRSHALRYDGEGAAVALLRTDVGLYTITREFLYEDDLITRIDGGRLPLVFRWERVVGDAKRARIVEDALFQYKYYTTRAGFVIRADKKESAVRLEKIVNPRMGTVVLIRNGHRIGKYRYQLAANYSGFGQLKFVENSDGIVVARLRYDVSGALGLIETGPIGSIAVSVDFMGRTTCTPREDWDPFVPRDEILSFVPL